MIDIDSIKCNFSSVSTVVEVGRDGSPLSSRVLAGVHIETFAIMCATIMGAAGTASSEIQSEEPKSIVVKGPDKNILIVPTGYNSIIACVVEDAGDIPSILEFINNMG